MTMHHRLTQKALRRIFDRIGLSAEGRARLEAALAEESIVVPHPGYGRIVYDVPATYAFPAIKAKMEREESRYRSFFAGRLAAYFAHSNLDQIPDEQPQSDGYFWNNGYFPRGDARTLYAFVAEFAPDTFLEVGVGHSTRIARKAIEDFALNTRIRSIDPSPRADVSRISDEVICESVTATDPAVFKALRSGDMLFIDGSHVAHVGTDVPHIFLNVLPLLAPGVMVHVHDVFLPWEYYEEMRVRHYNEQHLLGAMLINGSGWEILFPVHYASQVKLISSGGGSFWIRKRTE